MSVVVEITTNSVQVTTDAANTVAVTETNNAVTVSAVGTQGPTGATGPAGPTGATGPAGPGVPTGGTTGQVLSKINATDYNTQWINPPATDKPYYTTGNAFPAGIDIGTATDLTLNAGYSNHCLILLDAGAASGSGVLLGVPAINRQIVLVNESPETITVYPSAGTSIHPDVLGPVNAVYYLRGYATLKLIGRDTTSWRIQEPIVDLSKNNIFGILPASKVDTTGLPFLSKIGNSGDPALGSYFFDVQVFGQFEIYDSNNPYAEGFKFKTETGNTDFFEMQTSFGGGRMVGSDANNLLTYFGGTPGGYDGLAWDAGLARLQTYDTFLIGNWEFESVALSGGDVFGNPDGILTAAQVKYWDNSAFNLSASGINFMNSGVNINTSGNLGVGASASATDKIFSLSTTAPQLTLAYNNTTAQVKHQVDSSGQLLITPGVDRANGISWRNAAATTTILKIDTLNTEISMGIGANTVGFFKGASGVTPQFVLGASGGKAVSLLAGSSGTAFSYDSTGTFAIATEARATMVSGTSAGGTVRVFMNSTGQMCVGHSSPASGSLLHVSGGVIVSNTGYRSGSAGSNAPYIFPFSGTTTTGVDATGRGLSFYSYANLTAQVGYAFTGEAIAHTTGNNTGNIFARGFTPTSGTGTFILTEFTGTINQTGGASGITRGLYMNHTLTAAADYRALEFTQNSHWAIYQSGASAKSYFNGTVSIGTGSTAAKLIVNHTAEQLRLGYDASNYYSTTISSAGTVTFDAVGASAGFTFNDSITVANGLFVGSSSAKNIFNASTATTVVDFDINASSTANNTFFRLGNGTMSTASSGVTNIISSTPSVNQSGTAGYNAINVNVTETATGSGAKNLMLLRVGGTERFSIDNGGIIKASAQVRLKGYTVATLPAGTQGDMVFVTDALAPTFGAVVVGGGAVVTPVFYDGTNWTAR